MLIGNFFKDLNFKYKNHFFSGLSFNSSQCKKNNIFFAIKGTNTNGEKFINNAIKNGARTIISKKKFQGFKKKILYINSKNVRKTLSEISFKICSKKPKNLIAVTGTNGKSSIVDFYYQILKFNKKKVASIGTLGVKTEFRRIKVLNTTQDPIFLSQQLRKIKKKNIDNIILEASSHGLKQNRLDGLNFKTGIFTNLSHDHLDYHKSNKDYLNSKLYLFKKLLKKNSNVITDNTIPTYSKIKKICKSKNLKLYTIGDIASSTISVIDHKYDEDSQVIKIIYKEKKYIIRINLIGKIQVKNILMAMIAAVRSGIKFSKIVKTIKKLSSIDGRFQNIGKIKNNSKVILDYAHTPDALKTCLQNLKDQYKNKKIFVVFGCGGERDIDKRPKMGLIANKYCDKIYLTDDNPRNENPKIIRTHVKRKINKRKLYEIPSREKAIEEAIKNLKSEDILLVAGKGHENTQDYGKSKKLFSDKICILKNINKKNNLLSNNFKLNILREETNNLYLKNNIKTNKASINSKDLKKNDIFFALKGKKRDGNNYVKEAITNGASIAVVNKFQKIKKSKQIKVSNTLNFLTRVASKIRHNSSAKIIAITGSCGKTSLKELVAKALSQISNVTYSTKSYNNKFGVPLSLFNLNKNDNFGIFEVGMDKKGEINNLTKIIKPDVGVITNISYAHFKNFKHLSQIAKAKSEIINNIVENGWMILNADDKFFSFHKKIALKKKLKIRSFSINKTNADIKLNYIRKNKSKFNISISIKRKNKIFRIPFKSKNNVKNLLAAVSLISIFKDIKNLNQNIFDNYKIPSGRGDISKIKKYNKRFFLIDESYNSNPLSLKSAINNFDLINAKKNKKYLLLGDMLELGKNSKNLHSQFSSIINNSSVDNLSIIGKDIKETYKNIYKNKKGLILKENSQIFDLIKNNINNNDYLMIKGSNATGLYKIANALKKGRSNAL